MKKLFYVIAMSMIFVLFIAADRSSTNPYGMKKGTPGIKSISALAFGPDGILFIGDSKSASVFAIDTKDKIATDKAANVEIKNIDVKIAASLGTEVKNIRIKDIAVNPVSKKIYCAVENVDGTPVLLKLDGETIQPVSLKDIEFSTASIANVPGEDQKDNRGRSLRESVISDLNFADGSVMLSGISNQEFSSTFRVIPFPFTDKQQQSSLEIYHAAHGRYETNSPIRTFTTTTLNGKKYLVASYTCTPLVLFAMDELQPGKHVKGRTVAEMGAGNSPLDMVTLKRNNDEVLVMTNSKHPLAKVDYKNIASFEGTLTEPVKGTAGVGFTATPMKDVLQMDKLDDTQVVLMQKKENGDVDLWTANESAL